MSVNFDTSISRRGSGSIKWEFYPADVLPLWVADADFAAPPAVIAALRARVDHGIYGYQMEAAALREVLIQRLAQRHQLTVTPQQIVFMPGLGVALNVFCRAFGAPGDAVMLNPPVYPPFSKAVHNAGKVVNAVPLASTMRDGQLYYEMDFDAMTAAITPRTKLFLLCSPHNPVGRAFTRAELNCLLEFVERHDLIVCADEIHCDLPLEPTVQHVSFAALGPEAAARTITLLAPSKTFNLPGLGLGFAVATDPGLLRTFSEPVINGGLYCGPFGYTGALAAYTAADDWLTEQLAYLRGNRDTVTQFFRQYLPHIALTHPEATYLSWIDLRAADIEGVPAAFLQTRAKVALNDGATFGTAGTGFVRLNFGCTRATLTEALERLRAALAD